MIYPLEAQAVSKPKQYKNESDVKKECKRLLTRHGWFWWMPPANGFGRSGISDINALKKGVFMALETKFGKNPVTPMQRGYLNSVLAEDGFAFVVDENKVEWFGAWCEAFDRAIEAGQHKEMPTNEDGAMMVNAVREMIAEI